MLDRYARQLEELEAGHRLRRLMPRAGIDFASNDYLGMANDPVLRQAVADAIGRGVPVGSGGSRLLRGNHPEHETLEAEAAAFYGSEAALLLATGYAANSALLATLPRRGDHLFFDELVHASAHEGMRLSFAHKTRIVHNDAEAFDQAIRDWRHAGGTGVPWIVVESLYSMDGDRAPLADLAAIADRHEAMLLIDEAHATGVFGRQGRGLADGLDGRDNVIVLRTLGKALGCEGALVCCPAAIREWLVNTARGFIFSTAPSPLMAAAARTSIRIVAEADGRRQRLRALSDVAATKLARHGVTASGSQILPLILGDDDRTMAVAARLQAAGLDVRGIRPPTVPPGTSRLRISLTLNIGSDAIDALDDALAKALA